MTETIQVHDIQLAVQRHGDPAGEPVLLIHGLGSSGDDWQPQFESLAEYQVLAVDLRGHGGSTKRRGPFDIRQHARDMAALLQATVGPAHVAGVSLGGMVAMQLALDEPDLVRSLIVLNSTADTRLRSWARLKAGLMRVAAHLIYGMEGTARMLAPRLFPKPEQEHLRQQFRQRWVQNDSRSYFRCLLGAAGWSVVDRLAELRCPVLMIGADRDFMPAAELRATADRINTAGHITAQFEEISDAGHAAAVERPDAVNPVLMAFLQNADRKTRPADTMRQNR